MTIKRSNMDRFSKKNMLAASKFPKFSFETLFRFVQWIVCPQSSFEQKECEKKLQHRFRGFFFNVNFNWLQIAIFRKSPRTFVGVTGSVIKMYVLQIGCVLMQSERKKNNFNFYQKKSCDPFLESWRLMNINPNSMILKHEIDPVYL